MIKNRIEWLKEKISECSQIKRNILIYDEYRNHKIKALDNRLSIYQEELRKLDSRLRDYVKRYYE